MNWRGVKITIAADVTNPLTGERGAAKIFGPQKGASPAQVKILDAGLRHFAEICGDRGEHRGDGAAGGLGFALRKFLGAKMVSGAEQLFRDFDFAKKLRGADLVITGEGQSDAQTAGGKLAVKVAQAARKEKVPALLLSGALAPDAEILEPFFAAGIFAIATQPQTLTAALAAAEKNLERAARNLLKAIFARS
jgi:glycerate kinase